MNTAANRKKFLSFTVCAAAATVVSLPLVTAVVADPPAHAPAHGYYKDKNNDNRGRGRGRDDDWRDRDRNRNDDWSWRNRDNDRRDRDGDWRNRDGDWRDRNGGWRGNGGWNDGNRVGDRGTMTATVIRDLSGDRFEVRADDNRTFTVRSTSGQSRRIRTGDRVYLTGYLTDRNTFVAESVQVIGNGYGNGYGYGNDDIDFYATVISTSSRNYLTVRADDGQTFSVTTRNSLSSNVNRGDRVRVTGLSTNRNVVSNATVVLVNNGGWGGGYGGYGGYGQSVSFYGTVESSSGRGGIITVRGDNGRTYTVRPNNDSTFRRGERVRIVGTANGGTVNATSISRF